jgi:hypothetical protein
MLKLQKVHLKEVKEKEDIMYFYSLFTTPESLWLMLVFSPFHFVFFRCLSYQDYVRKETDADQRLGGERESES